MVDAGAFERLVREADARGVSAFKIFSLVADLRLSGVLARAVGRRGHAQDAVARRSLVLQERDALPPPGRARHAGPTGGRADDPAVARHLSLAGVAEVVEQNLRSRPFGRSRFKRGRQRVGGWLARGRDICRRYVRRWAAATREGESDDAQDNHG